MTSRCTVLLAEDHTIVTDGLSRNPGEAALRWSAPGVTSTAELVRHALDRRLNMD